LVELHRSARAAHSPGDCALEIPKMGNAKMNAIICMIKIQFDVQKLTQGELKGMQLIFLREKERSILYFRYFIPFLICVVLLALKT